MSVLGGRRVAMPKAAGTQRNHIGEREKDTSAMTSQTYTMH